MSATRQKSLDRKLAALARDPAAKEFILADAKDADMAFGIGAPGKSPEMHAGEARARSIQEYRDIIRAIVQEELVDIMLMSASTSEILTLGERLFDDSPVTPACRANDAFDVHVVRGGKYIDGKPRPFRTATLDHIQCGHVDCAPAERKLGADLGLYSVTFNNSTDDDLDTLERYNTFRLEAERKSFRHFLEVFNPNLPSAVPAGLEASFINDMIARTLAGVTSKGRPVFLKIVYNGPRAMEELVAYDANVIVGVLGGSAGTTYDAFKLLSEAKKYGARAALFGRKINQAENQFAFIRFLRLIADDVISPEDAVRAYHAVLERLRQKPHRPLEEDMRLLTPVMSYSSSKNSIMVPAGLSVGASSPWSPPAVEKTNSKAIRVTMSHACAPTELATTKEDSKAGCGSKGACHCGCKENKAVSFASMTSADRLAYHRDRIAKLLGER